MPINFNGNVTVNGNIENYENGIRISDSQIEIDIKDLESFIEKTLPSSPNKEKYKEAARTINQSTNKNVLKEAFLKLNNLASEVGRTILISGFSELTREVAKAVASKVIN